MYSCNSAGVAIELNITQHPVEAIPLHYKLENIITTFSELEECSSLIAVYTCI